MCIDLMRIVIRLEEVSLEKKEKSGGRVYCKNFSTIVCHFFLLIFKERCSI